MGREKKLKLPASISAQQEHMQNKTNLFRGALRKEDVHERLVHGQARRGGKRLGLLVQAGAAAGAHAVLHGVDAKLRVLQRACSGGRVLGL